MSADVAQTFARLRNTKRKRRRRRTGYVPFFSEVRITQLKKKRSIMENKSFTQDMFLSSTSFEEHTNNLLFAKRFEKSLETFFDGFNVHATGHEWRVFADSLQELRRHQTERNTGVFFDDESLSYLHFNVHSSHVTIQLVGDENFIENYAKLIESKFEVVLNEIEWIYSNDGSSIEIPLRNDRMPMNEMYPFLNGQDIGQYYDDFMASSASILLLIGPPGTGKTTFIRGLLQHTESSAIVSYDAAVLEKDYVFSNFIESSKSLLILEDADMFLKSRKEGNTMMHKFLNVGDGLVTTRGKKLIFSTNLPSINDVDPALIRPGRCYDILHFDELNQKQAEVLAEKVGVKLNGVREKWSIADIFHEKATNIRTFKKPVEKKFGFV
jgi:hypothetical protein